MALWDMKESCVTASVQSDTDLFNRMQRYSENAYHACSLPEFGAKISALILTHLHFRFKSIDSFNQRSPPNEMLQGLRFFERPIKNLNAGGALGIGDEMP